MPTAPETFYEVLETVTQIDKHEGPLISKEETQNLHTGVSTVSVQCILMFISSSRFSNGMTNNLVFNKDHELLYSTDNCSNHLIFDMLAE